MVTLNTLLLVSLIVAPVAAVATIGSLLLIGIYLIARDLRKMAKKDENEDCDSYTTIPLSQLAAMGGGRMPTQAEVEQVKAAIAQAQGRGVPAPGPAPDDKKEAYTPGGYL